MVSRRSTTEDRAYVAIALAGSGRMSRAALRHVIARAVEESDARVLRTAHSASVVRAHVPRDDVRAAADALRQHVSTVLGETISAGVAGPKAGASGAHFALVQAEHALVVGRTLRGGGRTVHFDDLGSYCFVLNQPTSDVRLFTERLLGPLFDDERHVELVDTLEAFLRSSGCINAVAAQLYIHRNTVRHRLRRIAGLLGADLDDPDTRLALQLAILGRSALARIAS